MGRWGILALPPDRGHWVGGLTRTQFVIASAQRRGDLVAMAAFLAPTRLPRSARNDSSRETGYACGAAYCRKVQAVGSDREADFGYNPNSGAAQP